jgi:hypothetical protein
LETSEPICCTYNKQGFEGENNVKTYIFDTIVHVDNINQLASKHHFSPLAEEEQNKEPLIAEWSYISCNPKPLDTPQTVHNVGDLVGPRSVLSDASQKLSVSCSSDNDGDVLNSMGRRIAHLVMGEKQSTNMHMPSIDDAR